MKRPSVVLAFLGAVAGASTPAPMLAAQTISVGARMGVQETARPGSGWLGVRSSLMVEVALDGSTTAASNLTITDVYRDGPAWSAGIRAGDVVVGVNGLPLRMDRFQSLAERLIPGDPVSLTVLRGTRRMEFSLEASPRPEAEALVSRQLQDALDSTRVVFLTRLDSAPFPLELRRVEADSIHRVEVAVVRTSDGTFEWSSDAKATDPRPFSTWAYRGGEFPTADSIRWMVSPVPPAAPRAVETRPLAPYLAGMNRVAGAEFTPLVGELATYFQTEDGLLVTDVAEGTPAADAGLTPGDVIVAVRGRSVTSIDQLRAALSAAEHSPTLAVVRRGLRIEVRLPG